MCSATRWELQGGLYVVVVACVGFAALVAYRAQKEEMARLEGDMVWTLSKLFTVPLMALFIGVVAGLLGLGGGELMAPLLVALGMHPQVV